MPFILDGKVRQKSGSLQDGHHFVSKMLDVPNGVAGSGVVVKGWSYEFLRELTLQDCLGEREIRDFGSGLLWSAMKLQFHFFDPFLDQLVDVSDVGELLDPPSSLAVLNSRSEMRQISFIVRRIFA